MATEDKIKFVKPFVFNTPRYLKIFQTRRSDILRKCLKIANHPAVPFEPAKSNKRFTFLMHPEFKEIADMFF
jgi:hypothetical protein